MGPKSRSLFDDHRGLGSTSGRCVCKSECKDNCIIFPPQRGPSVSLIPVNTASSDEIPRGIYRPNLDCSFLAKGTMVLDAPESVSKASLEIAGKEGSSYAWSSMLPESGTPQFGSLVSEEDLLRRRGLSDKLITTLLTNKKKC